jgi:RNA polymerase sigma-70 factor (ECF subfamily)
MGSSGSEWNVERLVDAFYLPLYRYAYRLTGSVGDAEDLTQETFCKAQHKRDQLRDPLKAKAWLFSILRNAYLHRVRTEKQRPCLSLDQVGELAEPLPDPLPPVDPERLQQALHELPELFRTPLILYYFEDFSYRDIAEQMDLPLGTVMSRLARAKAFLRSRLLPQPASLLAQSPRRTTDGL